MQNSISTNRLFPDVLTKEDNFIISIVNTKGWIEFIGDRNVHPKEDAFAISDSPFNRFYINT